jgi:hypothetical protein
VAGLVRAVAHPGEVVARIFVLARPRVAIDERENALARVGLAREVVCVAGVARAVRRGRRVEDEEGAHDSEERRCHEVKQLEGCPDLETMPRRFRNGGGRDGRRCQHHWHVAPDWKHLSGMPHLGQGDRPCSG